jgi:hypothetical protein
LPRNFHVVYIVALNDEDVCFQNTRPSRAEKLVSNVRFQKLEISEDMYNSITSAEF